MRSTLQELAPHVRPWVPVVSLAKGLEQGTHLRMTEVITEELPGHPAGVLTGPNLAKEILAGHAAARWWPSPTTTSPPSCSASSPPSCSASTPTPT